MGIEYALYPNHLTDDPNDYYATTQATHTRNRDDIVDGIIAKGSTLSRNQIIEVLDSRDEVIKEMLLEGERIKTSLATFQVTVKGVFNGPNDAFDPTRHQLYLAVFSNKEAVAHIQQNGHTTKVEGTIYTPKVERFVDVVTGEVNSIISIGMAGNVEGRRLNFDPEDPGQGVFFVDDSGAEHRAQFIARNKPSELVIMVPGDLLPATTYRLQVRSVIHGHTHLSMGELPHLLNTA